MHTQTPYLNAQFTPTRTRTQARLANARNTTRNNNENNNGGGDAPWEGAAYGAGARVLKLTLSDGVREVSAMEYKPVPQLDVENLRPGTKVCVCVSVCISVSVWVDG